MGAAGLDCAQRSSRRHGTPDKNDQNASALVSRRGYAMLSLAVVPMQYHWMHRGTTGEHIVEQAFCPR
jgi:hypothetical protein